MRVSRATTGAGKTRVSAQDQSPHSFMRYNSLNALRTRLERAIPEDQPRLRNVARFLLWAVLAAVTVLIVILALVPYYGSGMHYPSSPPGTIATSPDEYYSMSLFRGTPWEGQPWGDIFWNVGCFGWCL